MAFDISASVAVTVKDGTVTVGYFTDSITDEDQAETNTGAIKLANGASDVTISLGGITTVAVLAIESDFLISLKFNGISTGIAAKSYFMRACAITSIAASNSSGSEATVRYVMAGA